MTTYPFIPTNAGPFQFQPVLDGASRNAIILWNVDGQRWYFNLLDGDGTRLLTRALVGSPTGFDLQTLSWARGYADAVAAVPHGLPIGATVNLTVRGCSPDALNGKVQVFVKDAASFTYPIADDPGPTTAVGSASFDVDLVEGYFDVSTVVFREASATFEVSP